MTSLHRHVFGPFNGSRPRLDPYSPHHPDGRVGQGLRGQQTSRHPTPAHSRPSGTCGRGPRGCWFFGRPLTHVKAVGTPPTGVARTTRARNVHALAIALTVTALAGCGQPTATEGPRPTVVIITEDLPASPSTTVTCSSAISARSIGSTTSSPSWILPRIRWW
jgi:hypothetical protein